MDKFFTYAQNNSGGAFHSNEDVAPFVIIEAACAEEADRIAQEVGLYFDGKGDCPCCGHRWFKALNAPGDDEPNVHAEYPSEYVDAGTYFSRTRGEDLWEVIVYYQDGSITRYRKGTVR
jgi:hypothetical protein